PSDGTTFAQSHCNGADQRLKGVPMTYARVLCLVLLTGSAMLTGGCHTATTAKVGQGDKDAIPAAQLQHGDLTVAQLVGGDLGSGGGYLIAAAPEKIQQGQHAQALAAAQKAEQMPASLESV